MYYFAPETLFQANKNIESLDSKFGGLLCVLHCLTENLEENKSYTINGEKLRQQLSFVFDKEPRDSFDNVKSSYIIFAKDWVSTFFDNCIKHKVDLLSCAVFFLRRQAFEYKFTKDEVIDLFIDRFNLRHLKERWFCDISHLELEYNQLNAEDNQSNFYGKMNYGINFKSILFQNTIQKSAFDIKAAGQIQTLYSGSVVQKCFLLSDEPLDRYYIMTNNTEEETSIETKLTPDWFKSHEGEFNDVLAEAETQYEDFQSRFAPEILAQLRGEELLHKMFYSEVTNKDNLCYYLEFHTKVRELFGSVAGGSAYKFNLFYQKKKSSWVTGSSAKPKLLSLDEAIILGTEIRDALVRGAEIIKANQDINDAEGYNKLYNQLFATLGKYINLLWVQKYYHMIFPDMFPVFYNEAWQRHVLDKLNIEPYDSGFVRMGQISLFAKECDIENVIFAQIIYKYCTMVDEGEPDDKDDTDDVIEEAEGKEVEEVRQFIELNFTTNIDCDFERNRIVFGAPGTGKSYQMEEDRATLVKMGGDYERVTFHPDYTYSSFVGCYKPVSENGKIEYKYVPGPFMRVLVEALRSGLTENPKPYLLIIEEINRAKVAAVFGEVFQLLDRDSNGTSDYEIHTSEDVRKYLSDELNGSMESFARIRIPNNMFIWATMNSADQGVFPMDTAFKRRWSFEYKGIDENEGKVGGKIVLGEGEHEFEVDWNVLRKAINEVLAKKFNINEDKLMGPFFMSEDVFAFGEDGYIKNPAKFKKVFKSKVIMYLYEDAAKQQKHKLFSGCDSTKYSSICDAFDKIGIDIFGADFKDTYNDLR